MNNQIFELPLVQLREFLSAAAPLKISSLYPSLDCIKIEAKEGSVTYTKTNMAVWCVREYSSPGANFKPVLFNERALNGFVGVLPATFTSVRVTETDNGLLLQAGTKKQGLPKMDVALFPNTPLGNDAKNKISVEVLQSIKVAEAYYSHAPLKTVLSNVHVTDTGVFASDGRFIFHNNNASSVDFYIDEDVIAIVRNLGDEVYYSRNGNYDWFHGPIASYAFVQKEGQKYDYMVTLNKITGAQSFTIDKQALVDFCTQVENTTTQEVPYGTFEAHASDPMNKLHLKHTDADFNKSAEDEVAIFESNYEVPVFTFCTTDLLRVIKPLPYARLTFTFAAPHYKITTPEDPAFTGVISALQAQKAEPVNIS